MNDQDYFDSIWNDAHDSMASEPHLQTTYKDKDIEHGGIVMTQRTFSRGTSVWKRYFYFSAPDFQNGAGFTHPDDLLVALSRYIKRENYQSYLRGCL